MISKEKIAEITTVVLDIDGVLTDGRVGYSSAADEVKFFHVRDGHGIKLAIRAGLKVGALSGRHAAANTRRAEELGFSFIYQGEKDKRAAFAKLLEEQNLKPEQCLYIGDDIVDAVPMQMAGIAVTVADAPEYMDNFCDIRTKLPGGKGAVREVLDWLLLQQGKWEQLMKRYLI